MSSDHEDVEDFGRGQHQAEAVMSLVSGDRARSPRLSHGVGSLASWYPAPSPRVARCRRDVEDVSDSEVMIEMPSLADTASATAARAAATVATAASAAASAGARATATAATVAAGAAAVSVVAVATAGAAISRGAARRLNGAAAGTTAEPLLQSSTPASASSTSVAEAPMPSPRGGDRECFICLMEGDKDSPLIPCCSTCFARVHLRCWREWRNNQRVTALRSRLLGSRMQTNHLLRCTICKAGTAVVAGEEDGLNWMNELLDGNVDAGGGGDVGARSLANLVRRDDSDDEREAQLEDLVDMRTCGALAVYFGVLVVVLIIACTVIATQRFYAGDVVLCCIIALYELSVLQIIVLAVTRRRGVALVAAAASVGNGAAGDANGSSRTQAATGPVAEAVAAAAAARAARASALGEP